LREADCSQQEDGRRCHEIKQEADAPSLSTDTPRITLPRIPLMPVILPLKNRGVGAPTPINKPPPESSRNPALSKSAGQRICYRILLRILFLSENYRNSATDPTSLCITAFAQRYVRRTSGFGRRCLRCKGDQVRFRASWAPLSDCCSSGWHSLHERPRVFLDWLT